MLKEIIIIILVIVFVISINIVTQNYTVESLETVSNQLENLKEKINDDRNHEGLQNTINSIENEWQTRQNKLSYYIEHDELEKVQTQVTVIKSDIETQEYNYGISEIDKCIFILEHIKEKEKLDLKNIF